MTKEVSNEYDSYVIDKDETVWIATLSNGEKIYQDDERPGFAEPISWKRLRNYCYAFKLDIVSLSLRFRSHTEFSCDCKDGAFFRRGVLGIYGDEKTTRNFYVLGSIDGDSIYTRSWFVPEIIEDESEIRSLEGNENGIIWNSNHELAVIKQEDHNS